MRPHPLLPSPSQPKKPKLPPPPNFPTLSIQIPSTAPGDSPTPFVPNSRAPVPLVTPTFVGHALLVLKPKRPEDDAVYSEKIFKGKQRKVRVCGVSLAFAV